MNRKLRPEYQIALAQNPNTHPDILRTLSLEDPDEWVKHAAETNLKSKGLIKSDLHKSEPANPNRKFRREHKIALAQNPNTHPDILHALHQDENWMVRQGVAQNPNTHPDILHALHQDKDWMVRQGVAQNPNTHPDILHALHQDKDWMVRQGVAQNPNTHPDILHALHQDKDWMVRQGVAQNPNTHPDILHALHQDENSYVRQRVAQNPNARPNILHALHQDKDSDVRQTVAQNPNTHPDILHALHQDENSYVRRAVAENPNTHPDILRTLSLEDPDEWVKHAAETNLKSKGLIKSDLHKSAEAKPNRKFRREHKIALAQNPNARPNILHALHQDKDWMVRQGVAQNPNTHPDILHALHQDKDRMVRQGVAQNPNTHPDILHALHQDENWMVKYGVAQNPNTHPDILHALHQDENWMVKYGVAQNPNTHPDILRTLSLEDPDEWVKHAAETNLKSKGLIKSDLHKSEPANPNRKFRREHKIALAKNPNYKPMQKSDKSQWLSKSAESNANQKITLRHILPKSFSGPESLHTILALHNNKVVGELSAEPIGDKHFSANMVQVHPTYQGRGIATAMYRHLENKTKRTAIPDLEAMTKEGQYLWRRPHAQRGFGPKDHEFDYKNLRLRTTGSLANIG